MIEGQLAARGSSSVYITTGARQALEFIISDSESQESHLVLIQQLGDATSCGSRVSPKTLPKWGGAGGQIGQMI